MFLLPYGDFLSRKWYFPEYVVPSLEYFGIRIMPEQQQLLEEQFLQQLQMMCSAIG